MSDYTGRTVITAYFDTRNEAQNANYALVAQGIATSDLRFVEGAGTSTIATPETHEHRGFFESLADFFMPDEDRSTYAEGLRRGGYVLAVTTDAANDDSIYSIFEANGAVDLDSREAEWRSEGWSSERPITAPVVGVLDDDLEGTTILDNDSSSRDRTFVNSGTSSIESTSTPQILTRGNEQVVQAAEERLLVGKRDVSHGRVRIRSYVVETPVNEQVSLTEERVFVERRPVDRAVNATDATFQDRVIEAEERSEEAVVSKQACVTEEISINKQVENRTETITDTLRKQEVEIEDERIDPDLRPIR